jgi:hypothetical protein
VREAIDRALAHDDAEQIGEAVRTALARALTEQREAEATAAREREQSEAAQARHMAAAKQSLALVDHGLTQLSQAPETITPRLASFLRSSLSSYAHAVEAAGAPEALAAPDTIANRILGVLAERQVATRPARVGILTNDEIAAIAAGELEPTDAATVRSTGDLAHDLARWQASPAADAERRVRLAEGQFQDGEMVFATIRSGETGRQVDVYPLTADGHAPPEPVAEFTIEPREERVSAVSVLVEPTVVEPRRAAEPGPLAGLISTEPIALAGPVELRDMAVALNQARIDLYAEILSQRPDLTGEARTEAERRLARMQEESLALADAGPEPSALVGFLAQWSSEIQRDLATLAERTPDLARRELYGRNLGALSRMGALQTRLDSLLQAARGEVGTPRTMRGMAEPTELVRPEAAPASIFDTLAGAELAQTARKAAQRPVPGEKLSAAVALRDVERSAPPEREAREFLRAVRATAALHPAMTTASAFGEAGLGLSSDLKPLLRAQGMPAEIRPDTSSPLLRNLLLPAMERVSGKKRTLARRGQAPKAPALYSAMLKDAGMALAQARPGVARSLMTQMGNLSERLSASGSTPTLAQLSQTGEALRRRALKVVAGGSAETVQAARQDAVSARQLAAGAEEDTQLVREAQLAAADAEVDQVARAMEGEAGQIDSGVRRQIAPDVDVAAGQRVISGPVSTAALSQMGALGATVGTDIYVREDLSGVQRAAVIGHEAVHAKAAGGTVEEQESAAYATESAIYRRLADEARELAQEETGLARMEAPSEDKDADELDEEPDPNKKIQMLAMLVLDKWLEATRLEQERMGTGAAKGRRR